MKTNPNDPAQPEIGTVGQMHESGMLYGDTYSQGGLTKREHFAAMACDDFDQLHVSEKNLIVGYAQPTESIEDFIDGGLISYDLRGEKYLQWLLKGRANWKLMQADALIEALNKQGE